MEINKPDYSDLYKFVTSIGLMLILLSILVPWVLFADPFNMISDSSNPASQELVKIRQQFIFWMVKNLKPLSFSTAAIGFSTFGFGLNKWVSRQKVRDNQERLAVEKLSLEIRKMTPTEKFARVFEDVVNFGFASQIDMDIKISDLLTDSNLKSVVSFQRLEDRVINAIARCYGRENLKTDLKIGSHYADLVLDIDSKKRAVIEISYESNPKNIYRKFSGVLPELGYVSKNLDSLKPPKRNFGLALIVVDFPTEEQVREAEDWARYKYRDVNAKLITLEQVDRLETDCQFLTNLIEY